MDVLLMRIQEQALAQVLRVSHHAQNEMDANEMQY